MTRNTIIAAPVVFVVMAAANMAYVQSMPTTREIKVQAFDFFFMVPGVPSNNPTITVRSGDTIVLTLQNMAAKNDHEFFVLTLSGFNNYMNTLQNGQNASEPEPAFMDGSVEDVPAGQSKTGTFVVGQAGTYVYACLDKDGTDPLTHGNKGMLGTFEVQNGGIFSLGKNLGSSLSYALSSILSNIPSIMIWQAAIALSIAGLLRRNAT